MNNQQTTLIWSRNHHNQKPSGHLEKIIAAASVTIGLLLLTCSVHTVAASELESTPIALQTTVDESSFYGRIEAVNQATVSAETQGRIESIHVNVGDVVSTGTIILTMTSTEQRAGLSQAEANLADTRSNWQADNAEYQRIKTLAAKGFVSKTDLDRVTVRLNTSKSRVASAEAALRTAREQLSYTAVKAPYEGVVSARLVEPGEAVRPGTLLLSGYDPTAFRVEVDLPQAATQGVRQHLKARVVPAATNGNPAAEILPEQLIIYPTIDPATSTVRVRLNLPANTANLTPGQFVKVFFMTGETQRLLVPLQSVVYRSEVTAVYVVEGDNTQLRQIRAGAQFGNQLEVLAGLNSGERIATDTVAAAKRLSTLKVEE